DFGADALEANDAGGAKLAAIESDVVGADAGGEAGLVDELGRPFVDFEPELALLGVPIEVEVAGEFLCAGGFFGNGGSSGIGGAERKGARQTKENGKENPYPLQKPQRMRHPIRCSDIGEFQHVWSLRWERTFYNKRWRAGTKSRLVQLGDGRERILEQTACFGCAISEYGAAGMGLHQGAAARKI